MKKDESLPSGKLKYDLLDSILKGFSSDDPRVRLGPRVGEDAAVIDMGDRCLVVTTDPITFTAENIGHYSINVNANDIAVHGAVPKWFLVTLLLPEGETDENSVRGIFDQVKEAMRPLGISLIGGHTEVTDSVTRPVISGVMMGEVEPAFLITTGGAKPGDLLFLTKGIPIEGTAIIAAEKEELLLKEGVDPKVIADAKNFLMRPGISVVEDTRIAAEAAPITSMHDPTEGGLAAGLNELAIAANVTISVKKDSIPVYPEGEALCKIFDINPIGTISSGALLFTAAPEYRERLEAAFGEKGIPLSVIGGVEKPSAERVYIIEKGSAGLSRASLPYIERDEILKIFG
ncbi:MAG: AIR synthase family protein [Deltaproteobacteria bacterium]|uniref:AIR synthase family protein n=1 Tax=Candidatus Zymogenus saltonus TaxID=2844893 RepID=A0A9D8KF76_9DELT|nr:AIR synthase family protein [Candidatus Zymogenus saltonus]